MSTGDSGKPKATIDSVSTRHFRTISISRTREDMAILLITKGIVSLSLSAVTIIKAIKTVGKMKLIKRNNNRRVAL